MSKALVEQPETELVEDKTALGTIIRRINTKLGSSLVSLMGVGTDLNAILEGELYAKRFSSFKELVEAEFGKFFSYAQARRLMNEAIIYNAIKQAVPEGSAIPLPSSENQLRPFLSFTRKPSTAGQKYVEYGEQAVATGQQITGEGIQDFLRYGTIETPAAAPKWVAQEAEVITEEGDATDIDFSAEPAPTKFRTVAATATLNKIEALSAQGVFPPNVRQHIEDEVIVISDDELESWGLKSDEDFTRVGFLLFNTRTKAFNADSKGALQYGQIARILEKPLNENTSLLNLVHLTISKGKKESNVRFRGFTVSAKLIEE